MNNFSRYMLSRLIDRVCIFLEDYEEDAKSEPTEEINRELLEALEWLHQHLQSLAQLAQDPKDDHTSDKELLRQLSQEPQG